MAKLPRKNKLSVIGVLIMTRRSCWPKSAARSVTYESKSGPGLALMMLIAPPVVFLPNSVPCGPRSISTRSTSSVLMKAPRLPAR